MFAYKFLPVAALPSAEFPVVNVSAQLPGASPQTMATAVATPLIKQFATIAGIDSIATVNSLGSTSIAIQFVLNRDIDAAAADVQAAIARTLRTLPPEMTSPPSYRKVNPADAPILLMALTSEVVPLTDLDAFAQNIMSPSLSTLDGVAQVAIFGSQKYAVRIQIDPTALAARGIAIDQLETAVANANSNTPLGTLSNDRQQLTITADTQLDNAAAFSDLIIATRDGHPVRLGDVTRVIDSVEVNPHGELVRWRPRHPACGAAAAGRQHRRGGRPCKSDAAVLRQPVAGVGDHQAAQRPLDFDPGCRQRRRIHAGADHRAGRAGDLPVPAPRHRNDHPRGGGADLADRHARRHVSRSAFRSTTSR